MTRAIEKLIDRSERYESEASGQAKDISDDDAAIIERSLKRRGEAPASPNGVASKKASRGRKAAVEDDDV